MKKNTKKIPFNKYCTYMEYKRERDIHRFQRRFCNAPPGFNLWKALCIIEFETRKERKQ